MAESEGGVKKGREGEVRSYHIFISPTHSHKSLSVPFHYRLIRVDFRPAHLDQGTPAHLDPGNLPIQTKIPSIKDLPIPTGNMNELSLFAE